ncbi:MAG: transglutaminase-like domain-containing protein [Gallintestinimicrobium sp.]
MPLRDAGEYPFEIFLSYVRHALAAENDRLVQEVAGGSVCPRRTVLSDQLEDISDCRSFYEQLKDRIAGLDEYQAAVEINYWCVEHATYEMADDRTAGPMTMYRSGKGRCGEESTFTVTALRSVGLAARQVYTPRWAHCDDNHAWVEVWVNGEWHFLGPASRKKTGSRLVYRTCRTGAFDSQPHIRRLCGGKAGRGNRQGWRGCLPQCHRFVYKDTQAPDSGAKTGQHPAAHAQVSVEILNMAEYFRQQC